ncbi:hypothetical protein Fot_41614 [Forsythia ovata]|uniref:Uncharacterized protein n=1 Tax=Forsythia ovata TaxID=205694 RepID=A0ABD1RIS9_9LAMI
MSDGELDKRAAPFTIVCWIANAILDETMLICAWSNKVLLFTESKRNFWIESIRVWTIDKFIKGILGFMPPTSATEEVAAAPGGLVAAGVLLRDSSVVHLK